MFKHNTTELPWTDLQPIVLVLQRQQQQNAVSITLLDAI